MLKSIRKYALQNAIKFKGKANPGAVIGKLISENPDIRKDMQNVSREINEEIKKINKLTIDQQTKELKKIAPELLEQKKQEKKLELPELPNAKKEKVVMRFEPSPSGPLHIGHAYALSLNSEYCRKYSGKLILRISDTNPENIYEPAYKLIPEDVEWITKNNIYKTYIQSDRMKIYYKYAEEILKQGHAYVCTCKPDDFREMINKCIACPCRNLSSAQNLDRWKKMFNIYKEGDAVVRIKTNINHKNPAMRDWPAIRIKEAAHPRQKNKYRVWPLLNFAVAIDDHDMEITHTIRAKDHMDNEKRQKYLADHMGWKMPTNLYVGRINFKDLKVSTTKTRQAIEEGKFEGWDDIRLPFLVALKRRGFSPDALIKYAISVGLTQNDKTVLGKEFFKTVDAFNKDIIDAKANRYFFIPNPVEIAIENAPEQNIELDLHPEHKKGGRKFKTNDLFLITKDDYNKIKENQLIRLMDCLNFRLKNKKFVFDSLEYEKFKAKGKLIIHWLPKNDIIKTKVRMPDNSILEGFAENLQLKAGDICQFERFGFVRKDNGEFWFAHH